MQSLRVRRNINEIFLPRIDSYVIVGFHAASEKSEQDSSEAAKKSLIGVVFIRLENSSKLFKKSFLVQKLTIVSKKRVSVAD